MSKSPSKSLTWLAILASTLAFAGFLWLRIGHLRSKGIEVFWLAELFSPVAFFSVLLVTFVERLVGPQNPKAKAKTAKRR